MRAWTEDAAEGKRICPMNPKVPPIGTAVALWVSEIATRSARLVAGEAVAPGTSRTEQSSAKAIAATKTARATTALNARFMGSPGRVLTPLVRR